MAQLLHSTYALSLSFDHKLLPGPVMAQLGLTVSLRGAIFDQPAACTPMFSMGLSRATWPPSNIVDKLYRPMWVNRQCYTTIAHIDQQYSFQTPQLRLCFSFLVQLLLQFIDRISWNTSSYRVLFSLHLFAGSIANPAKGQNHF